MARSRVASVRLQALSCPTWRSPSSRMLSAGTALLKESSTWALDFTGWFLSCATGCKLHSLWRIRWVSSELCGPTPTLPLWTIWSVLVCKDVQRSWPYIYYILSCGTHPTIRNWSCGHEWEGKRGGFPVPADIFIFIYYICIVASLGAFKSQLGGRIVYRGCLIYLGSSHRVMLLRWCFLHTWCIPQQNSQRQFWSSVCVSVRVYMCLQHRYIENYMFFPSIYV